MDKNRPTEYRRYKRLAVINRKKKIIKEQGDYWHYEHEGCLDKGKIHCSCWLCRRKSRDNARMDDARAASSMLEELREEGFENSTAARVIQHRTKNKNL